MQCLQEICACTADLQPRSSGHISANHEHCSWGTMPLLASFNLMGVKFGQAESLRFQFGDFEKTI